MTETSEISLWVPHYPFMTFHLDRTRELAAKFTAAHPGYQIEVTGWDYPVLSEELHRAALEGRQPTIAQYFYTSTQEALDTRNAAGEPAYTSLEQAIGGRSEILGEPVEFGNLVPGAREYYLGASMPLLTSTTLMYVNVDLLHAAGVAEIPRTWAELEAACQAVARHRGTPSRCITWPNHGWLFQQSIAQQGGLLADHDNGRCGHAETVDLASQAVLAYVDWWLRLYRDGHYLYLSHGTEVDWDGNFQAFADQQVVFALTSSVEVERMVQAGRDGGFTVRAAPMPYNDEVPYAGNVIGGDSLWLSSGLDERVRDGALAFIQYLLNPDNAAQRHQETNFIPVTYGAIRLLEDEGWFGRNPDYRVAIDQIEAGGGSPAARGALVGEFTAIQECMAHAMHDVLTEDADPRVRFRQATAKAQALLDGYNAYRRGERPRGPIRVG
jgi:sn-glycerol 3-phosphate transport system substrate-binding protein